MNITAKYSGLLLRGVTAAFLCLAAGCASTSPRQNAENQDEAGVVADYYTVTKTSSDPFMKSCAELYVNFRVTRIQVNRILGQSAYTGDVNQLTETFKTSIAKAKELLPQAQTALTRAPQELKGFEARKIPKLQKGLNQSITQLNDVISDGQALIDKLQNLGKTPATSTISNTTAEIRQQVAVMDFKTVGDSTDLGEGAAEILRTTLMETGKYTVVERSMLKEALKEQKLGVSGAVDQNTAVGIGKILGANLVAVGSVVKMGGSYTLNVRFVDVETSAVVLGKKLTTNSEDGIPSLCEQMVKLLTRKETAQKQEEETLPQPTEGNWALGAIYPGASLKYVTSGKSAWEVRAQTGSKILALGTRYYSYFTQSSNPRLYFGVEGDYITFKGNVSKGTGFAGGAFVGGEIFLTKQIGLLMDFGPTYISLSDNNFSETASSLEYVLNMGIYWHFK
jgi:TolB-like protein